LQIPDAILKTESEAEILKYIRSQLETPAAFYAKSDEMHIDVIKLKTGTVLECYSQPHKLNDKIIGRILDFHDITERDKLENRLIYQATHDTLTGLGNRVDLIEKMQTAIKTAEKNNSHFAVLFLDFDRFKLVNDSLSHVAGDELLRSAASRLQAEISKEDILARLGGDEFVIVLTNVHNKKTLSAKVKKVMSAFQQPFDIGERKLTLTVSIGISLYPKDGTTVDILLRNADAAMYLAKGHKGNNFQFYVPEMNLRSLAELDQETELREAIAKGEFFLCYQPEFDLVNEKLVAVEALLRWQHPTKGVLLPIDFIPLAEETGLIIPISEWVMKTACEQNKFWQDAGFEPIRVAVNITAQQFKLQNLTKKVREVLSETGLKPEYLELELTENVLLSSADIINTIQELKTLNITIAVDDFGTGYSSLSYLHKIPLDRLKIDASFIQHIQSASDDEVIIRAVIAMAKSLNLEVIAEGVETLDQLNFLKKYECGDVQGFYFSKPLTAQELEIFLKNYRNFKYGMIMESKE
ncbi:MAG: EAL domain-containing protein, partial [Gammaproteobacteria bacterium]